MASAMIPAVIVCCLIPMYPESPRWYLTKDRHLDAYNSICQLRLSKIQAARDLFYMHTGLEAEKEAMSIGKQNRLKEFISIRRNRNAMIGSEIVMFMQQASRTLNKLFWTNADQQLVLRSECYRLLFFRDLPGCKPVRGGCLECLSRLRRHQLAICDPGCL